MAKRSDKLAEELKDFIARNNLLPGDKLPQEKELIDKYGAAKSTVREALKSLETQGLITTRTGPGGGATVSDVHHDKATALLANYFHFKDLTIHDIYQLRIQLEPELAASVVGILLPEDFKRLQSTMCIYDSLPKNKEEEHAQRIAEFNFHEALVELCPNPLLGFMCHFLMKLLKNLQLCHDIYNEPNPELWETGRYYQMQLLTALKKESVLEVKKIMREHMQRAELLMQQKEALLSQSFFTTTPRRRFISPFE